MNYPHCRQYVTYICDDLWFGACLAILWTTHQTIQFWPRPSTRNYAKLTKNNSNTHFWTHFQWGVCGCIWVCVQASYMRLCCVMFYSTKPQGNNGNGDDGFCQSFTHTHAKHTHTLHIVDLICIGPLYIIYNIKNDKFIKYTSTITAEQQITKLYIIYYYIAIENIHNKHTHTCIKTMIAIIYSFLFTNHRLCYYNCNYKQ